MSDIYAENHWKDPDPTEQPVECRNIFRAWHDITDLEMVDIHRKDFSLEKALDFLRAHNDGVYKITASKHLDELVYFLLSWFQRHLGEGATRERESSDERMLNVQVFKEAVIARVKHECYRDEYPTDAGDYKHHAELIEAEEAALKALMTTHIEGDVK